MFVAAAQRVPCRQPAGRGDQCGEPASAPAIKGTAWRMPSMPSVRERRGASASEQGHDREDHKLARVAQVHEHFPRAAVQWVGPRAVAYAIPDVLGAARGA